jgi:hypothetical protein
MIEYICFLKDEIVCSHYEIRIKTRNNRSYIRYFTCLQPNNSEFYNSLFGSLNFKLYVHIMNIKTKIIILLVLTSTLFITLFTYRDIIGMALMGGISVYLAMALKSLKPNEQ